MVKMTIKPIKAGPDKLGKALVENAKQNTDVAKYRGTLPIGSLEIDCAVLENGTRILSATSVFDAFGRARKGINTRLEIDGANIPPFLAAKNLEPYIGKDILQWAKPIEYTDGSRIRAGYGARLLPLMCKVYLDARREGALTKGQMKLADQSEVLLTAFAQVGIDALVDEATGYQYNRAHDALRILLQKYITEGMQKWIKTFPDSFFIELDKLYNNESTTSQKRPQYYGHFINKYVYKPIENGYVKEKLDALNISDSGKRKARFHQWLTEEGKSVLTRQIGRVEMLMELCPDIGKFKEAAVKQKKVSIAPYLFDDMNNIIE